MTHLVFVGKLNDLTKEFRTARDDKKQIVSPEWIKMCNEEKRHVEEVRFFLRNYHKWFHILRIR